MAINVLSVASEAVPLVKTGGLADVAGALPAALAPHGVKLTTLLPGYPAVMRALKRGKVVHRYDDLLGQPARLVSGKLGDFPLLALDAPGFFDREGGPYSDPGGKDWDDRLVDWAADQFQQQTGIEIVRRAIQAPLRQIAANAGQDGAEPPCGFKQLGRF